MSNSVKRSIKHTKNESNRMCVRCGHSMNSFITMSSNLLNYILYHMNECLKNLEKTRLCRQTTVKPKQDQHQIV